MQFQISFPLVSLFSKLCEDMRFSHECRYLFAFPRKANLRRCINIVWQLTLVAGFSGTFFPGLGYAQSTSSFPNKSIRIIVPFEAGGSNDVYARAIANAMSKSLKQPVVVENRGGAGGIIGASAVAKAAADGYTLMLASSTFAISSALIPKLPFDPINDFTPIALVAKGPNMLVMAPQNRVRTLPELIDLARAEPGKITYASAGITSMNQMGTEMIAKKAGINLLHIPYKGGSQAVTDVIANNVNVYLGSLTQVMPHVREGRLQAIAVTGPRRAKQAPEVPALTEYFPDLTVETWWGIFAGGTVPRDVVNILNREVGKSLVEPDVKELMESEGTTPVGGTAEAFSKLFKNDLVRWKQVAEEANIRVGN